MTKPKSKASISVNKTTLEQLSQTLGCLLGQSDEQSKDNTNDEQNDVDPTDLTAVLNLLIQSVTVLTNHIKSLDTNKVGTGGVSSVIAEKIRVQEDEMDECRQRSLHGNLIVTSQAIPQKNKVSLLKSDQQLSQENQTITEHIINLVKEKYDVTLPQSDIQACHRLPNNSVIIRMWNRKIDSAWSKIVDGIKTGKNLGYNVFFNFHLTRRRSNLLYKIRQMKKTGDIAKFYSDENGQLTIMAKKKEDGGIKKKVTYLTKNRDSPPQTLYEEEMIAMVKKSNSWAEES